MKENLFSKKIKYLFNILELNQKDFVKLFWNGEAKTLSTRVKTIDNWLSKDIKQPKGFYFDEYKISKFIMDDGTPVFTKESFMYDDFDSFKYRIDNYIKYKSSSKKDFEYEFIYYYDNNLQKIIYMKLNIQKKIHDREYEIEIEIPQEYKDKNFESYTGTLELDRNYYYISVKNSFETMTFYFMLNLGYKSNDVIYGLGLGIAYKNGLPLATKNILTKKNLEEHERKEFYLNSNETEQLLSTEVFDDVYTSTKENYLKKFYEKIENIESYNSRAQKILKTSLCDDIYHNIMNKEFLSFSKITHQVQDGNSFFVHNRRRATKVFLESLTCKKSMNCYIVYPLFKNSSLLNEDDPRAEKSLKLNIDIAQKGLKLYRIFVVNHAFQMTKFVYESLKKMIENNIVVRVVKKEDIKHLVDSYDFVYSDHTDVAIYRKQHERFYLFNITRNRVTIDELKSNYKKIKKKSYKLDEFYNLYNPIEYKTLKEKNKTLEKELEALRLENKKLKKKVDYDTLNFENLIFQENKKLQQKLLGSWNTHLYSSTYESTGKIHIFKTYFKEHNNVIDFYENRGKLFIGDNQSLIVKKTPNEKNFSIILFQNIDVTYQMIKFVIISIQNGTNEEMIQYGFYSKKEYDYEETKKILGNIKNIQLKLDRGFSKRVRDEFVIE